MTLARARQDALLRGMAAVQRQSIDNLPLSGGTDPSTTALAYAMAVLGDPRTVVASTGSFTGLLETNNIAHRESRTPPDLAASTRATMVVFANDDDRPLAVHRLGGQTVAFDSAT